MWKLTNGFVIIQHCLLILPLALSYRCQLPVDDAIALCPRGIMQRLTEEKFCLRQAIFRHSFEGLANELLIALGMHPQRPRHQEQKEKTSHAPWKLEKMPHAFWISSTIHAPTSFVPYLAPPST